MKALVLVLGFLTSLPALANPLSGAPNAYGNFQVYRTQLDQLVQVAKRKDLRDTSKRDHMKKVLAWAYECVQKQETAHPYVAAMVKYELDPFNQWIRTAPMPEITVNLIKGVATLELFESYLF